MPFNIFLSFACGIAGACVVLVLNHPPRIATVNITNIVEQFAKSETEKKLSPEELKKRAQSFGAELEKNIKVIAQKDRLTVFPSEAVIEGAIDITPRVQKALRP